jgi:hypothetical protein
MIYYAEACSIIYIIVGEMEYKNKPIARIKTQILNILFGVKVDALSQQLFSVQIAIPAVVPSNAEVKRGII